MKQKVKQVVFFFSFIILCLMIGYLGSQLSGNNAKDVYSSFIKPGYFPPAWVFAPVWTILYILMGISAYLVWKKRKEEDVKKPLVLFFVQLILNLLWPILFFGLGNYLLAFVNIILLFIAICATMRSFEKVSKVSAYLLVPYLLWIGFATILNYTIL
jgi:translocator protein